VRGAFHTLVGEKNAGAGFATAGVAAAGATAGVEVVGDGAGLEGIGGPADALEVGP
jgi:hypothetical protein